MTKTSKKTEASYTARPKVAKLEAKKTVNGRAKAPPAPVVEPFSAIARRAADALADLVEHDDCPKALFTEVNQLMCNLADNYDTLALDIRARFVLLAARAAEEESERPGA